MKVKLLNDGGYRGLEDVNFPVEVDAKWHQSGRGAVTVMGYRLNMLGKFGEFNQGKTYIFCPEEIEVIEE